MYQRLLLIFSIMLGCVALRAQNVMTPTDPCYKYDSTAAPGSPTNPLPAGNFIQKWIHDPSQNGAGRTSTGSNPDTIGSHGFDQSTFKCYRYGTTSYRIRFPNGYDPANPAKYPMILFFHGAGEAAHVSFARNSPANRENQDQLYWGAQLFEQRMNQGLWNGFLLFPQVDDNSSQWDPSNPAFPDVSNVLDTLEKYNAFDPDRLIVMGLSAGGVGTVNYANTYPKRVASIVSSNPRFIESLIYPSIIQNFLQIPIWVAFGGQDNLPAPSQVMQFRDSVANLGGNIYATYHGTQGHSSWTYQWSQRDAQGNFIVGDYWNAAHKAQPLLYYQNAQFCTGQPINAKMAITANFAAYEWQYDGGGGFATIPGATTNTYIATQAGSYRVHFKRLATSNWSAWTPNPVVISTKACTADTAFAEHFEGTPIPDYITFAGGPVFTNSPYYKYNYGCQNGIFVNGTESFSQDATGRLGGRFMVNNTFSASGCTYNSGDQVWRTYNNVTVTPQTNYVFTFYMGNQGSNVNNTVTLNGGGTDAPITKLLARINGDTLSPVTVQTVSAGDVSWKKCTFIWNSGFTNSAELAITNTIASASGNNFVLDEISLVQYKGFFPMPGSAFANFTLWAKGNSITNTADGQALPIWNNSDLNGNNLIQASSTALPTYQNDGSSNMNFNPVVNFNAANTQYLQAINGFSGTTAHTAVTAYVVSRFNTLTQNDKNVLIETQLTQSFQQRAVKVTLNSGGRLSWTTGLDPDYTGLFTNTITTPNNSIEVNKPIVWSFSKDNAGTASGNKQDIRKNGVVVASGNTTSTFTGNSSGFGIGNGGQWFSGDIAEVVYLLDSAVTPARQNQIESYLAIKYGTTLGSPATPVNYTASDGTTLFWPGANSAMYAKFQNDVFGIGQDSASGLTQLMSNSVNSGSGNGTGQSGLGNLVLSSSSALSNKRFLMIGNNGNVLTQHIIGATETPLLMQGSSRISRNWKVANTGAVGPVDLSFDTTGLGNQAAGSNLGRYSLMISPSGDTTYSGAVSFFTANAVSGKKIIFSGVTLPDNAAFTIITNNLTVALPAVWLGFTAEAVNGNGLLNWKTGDETNVDHYAVEHSFNGVSFSSVGIVAAYNSTGENNYKYTDMNLAPGIHYYRIRRVDKDGNSGYSDIKSIKIVTTGANVQVRPNPVIGSNLAVFVSVQQSTKTNVQVMGVDGKVLLHQAINLVSGNNMLNLNISTVPPGVYLVQVQLTDEVVTKKFIKER